MLSFIWSLSLYLMFWLYYSTALALTTTGLSHCWCLSQQHKLPRQIHGSSALLPLDYEYYYYYPANLAKGS